MMDICDKEDIKIFVNAFYTHVQKDALIGPVFAARIRPEAWPVHLDRMYSFWNTVLFGERDYTGNPFSKHASLPIEGRHFERWVGLFHKTIDEHFEGEKAEEVKARAVKMGALFQSKLEHIRSNDDFTNLV